jgi:hypothetical protein
MKDNVVLTVASLLSILFTTLHMAGDIVRGYEKGGAANLIVIPICVLWLYGTLVLAGRRSGYIIILLMSLLGLCVPTLHMRGAGIGAHLGKYSGDFFFIWTMLAIGVTALFSVILSVRGLWGLRSGQAT